MFAIMGATGQTGGAAAAELQRRGAAVRLITRNPAGAANLVRPGDEIAAADPQDAGALARAFHGVEAAYVMVPPYLQADDPIGESLTAARAIAQAATAAAVPHLVALSSGGAHLAEGTGEVRTLFDLEAALRVTGLPVSYIRAGDFMENWAYAVPVAQAHGVLPSGRTPLDRPMETVAAADIGAVAADLLLEGPRGERVINLPGPREYSPADLAQALSDILGRPIMPLVTPRPELEGALIDGGIGPAYARELALVYDALNSGHIGFEPGVGEMRRGRVSLEAVLYGMVS